VIRVNAEISPEEQIRRVARAMLAQFGGDGTMNPEGPRPDLRGLITMLERHLEGKLPPIKAPADRLAAQAIFGSGTASRP
jgi:hypothetical protein